MLHIAARTLDQYRDPETLRYLSHGELLQLATLPFLSAARPLAKRGLAVIPCPGDDGKSPKGAVQFGRWRKRPGEPFINKLADKWPYANIGVLTHLSRLAVVDIDSDDRSLVSGIEREIGRTPLIARTPSSGFHLYFRLNGERNTNLRRYGLPIDIKASAPGYIVAPPSIRPSNARNYYFERGSWQDLPDLPPCDLQRLISKLNSRETRQPEIEPPPDLTPGQRNTNLFRYGLRQAHNCSDGLSLRNVLISVNDMAADPLPQAEVEKISRNVWHYQATENNWSGREARAIVTASEMRSLMSARNWADAWALYSLLRASHGARSQRGGAFAISARAMAEVRTMGDWDAKRIRQARDTLVDCAFIHRIHKGGAGKHDPSLYVFAGKP
jgi:Bifunctional DNA primase/polymerase, N-terminal